ncbi:MAG: sulfatase-like hydrolase/transferase [Thermoleophilaceae bacterium]
MRASALVLLAVVMLAAGAAFAVVEGDDEPGKRRPPVVILILDEFPTDTLTAPGGRIDAHRYPNFAALAETSTWFRNGQTVYDSSFKAVPSILDGRMPRPRTAADVRSHQPSIFHMMHELGYDVIKVESASAVCPPWICEGAQTRRLGVLRRLAGGGRPARLHKWIGAIRDRARPTLYLQHALLPHEPWIYLPSGRQSRPKGEDPVKGINKPGGWRDPGLTDHNHLRHLLQVGFTDHELGRLVRRLRRTGLFDRALLVVVADHGYSFELGASSRRQVTERNIAQIAPVPFFVKAPGQTEGRAVDTVVRTVDVVATVADLLDVPVPWRGAGRSAFSAYTRARRHVSMVRRDFSRVVSIDVDELERRREWLRRWRAAKFGTGARSERAFGDPWGAAYRIGPHPGLLGRPVPAASVARSSTVRGELANAGLLRHVLPTESIFPTRVVGRLEGGHPGAERDLAVAVNGRIRAVGRSFHLGRRPSEYFSLIVPESALRTGRNSLMLLEVRPGGELASLLQA